MWNGDNYDDNDDNDSDDSGCMIPSEDRKPCTKLFSTDDEAC